jgi:hypothetical protein
LVLADGTGLVSTTQNTRLSLSPSGRLALIAGDEDEDATSYDSANFKDGEGARARFFEPCGMTVDTSWSWTAETTPRRVSKAGKVEVIILAGNREAGLADGQGEAARFNYPAGLSLAANDEIVVADTYNHAVISLCCVGPPLLTFPSNEIRESPKCRASSKVRCWYDGGGDGYGTRGRRY